MALARPLSSPPSFQHSPRIEKLNFSECNGPSGLSADQVRAQMFPPRDPSTNSPRATTLLSILWVRRMNESRIGEHTPGMSPALSTPLALSRSTPFGLPVPSSLRADYSCASPLPRLKIAGSTDVIDLSSPRRRDETIPATTGDGRASDRASIVGCRG